MWGLSCSDDSLLTRQGGGCSSHIFTRQMLVASQRHTSWCTAGSGEIVHGRCHVKCDWIRKNRLNFHKNWNPIHSCIHYPHTHTNHIGIDGQVSFHRELFADPVNPRECTTRPVEPLWGFKKDAWGDKLLSLLLSLVEGIALLPVSQWKI